MCKHILFNDFNGDNDLQTLYRFVDRTSENDGYGAIIRDTSNKIHTFKSLDQTHFYLTLGYYLARVPIKTLVVHHRTSTNGDGLAYAHPFEFQGNYLTHNGVVSVPGKHETKTTNDSEELLHHLIKTGFDTVSIQGYFSCFILNDKETIVLVDDRAPIYTNGRTYSSHKLGKKWKQVELKRIHIPLDGTPCTTFDIQVEKSTYGYEKMWQSLGTPSPTTKIQTTSDGRGWEWDDDTGKVAFKPSARYEEDPVGEFLDYVSTHEEKQIAEARTFANLLEVIKEIAYNLGLRLTDHQAEDLAAFYIDREETA